MFLYMLKQSHFLPFLQAAEADVEIVEADPGLADDAEPPPLSFKAGAPITLLDGDKVPIAHGQVLDDEPDVDHIFDEQDLGIVRARIHTFFFCA